MANRSHSGSENNHLSLASDLASEAGIGDALAVDPIGQGGNNSLHLVRLVDGVAILKQYFRHPADPRDRLGAETAFLRHAAHCKIANVPTVLAVSPEASACLMTRAPGERVSIVGEKEIESALTFLERLNAIDPEPTLAPASEASFTIEGHLQTIERRLQRLEEISPESQEHRETIDLVSGALRSDWHRLADLIRDEADKMGATEVLEQSERCVSPSDFGFHNALSCPKAGLSFVDFEYAGVDDPAKLIGDFFHQVQVPVPFEHYRAVRDRTVALVANSDQARWRADLLFPIHAFKWAAILLNHFLPEGESRRRFAGQDPSAARRQQLNAAHTMLELARTRATIFHPGYGDRL